MASRQMAVIARVVDRFIAQRIFSIDGERSKKDCERATRRVTPM
jgi:hypothetical protein